MRIYKLPLVSALLLTACSPQSETPVGDRLSEAKSADGMYISWNEHIIDDPEIAGFALSGSDGLVMADLDGDGFEDIVSVHESDSEYDSSQYDPNYVPDSAGHVRIAFGSGDPKLWTNITLAEGADSPAPEDAAISDLNGDGHLDVIVAAELSHLIYLQNPGVNIRTEPWPRLIIPQTQGRGSYIRVFFGDFNLDGIPDVSAANKGSQRPGPNDFERKTPIHLFQAKGDPLSEESWHEIELGRYVVPQNAKPVDLDNDGDLDIIVGSRGEERMVFFENEDPSNLKFKEHLIHVEGIYMAGFNLEYEDLNRDGRLDIIGASDEYTGVVWIEQPENFNEEWLVHHIGDFGPDWMIGFGIADIDNDGDTDVISGSYSRGSRMGDEDVDRLDGLGRIGWFENPGDPSSVWIRHDITRRKRGMFDKLIPRDLDNDGDIDFLATRGNSDPYDGVIWLEQIRTKNPLPSFKAARSGESPEMPLP